MNTLREFILISSTFLWMGGGAWMISVVIASDQTLNGAGAYQDGFGISSYFFFGGITIFLLTTFLWPQKAAK